METYQTNEVIAMNLKDAFRFQNRIKSLMDEAVNILSRDDNIKKTETILLRKKVYADAEDEHTVLPYHSEYGEKINTVVDFLMFLIAEREKLGNAISKAKAALPFDMDSEISMNTNRQRVADVFRYMANVHNDEELLTNSGTGYRFNADGNQVSYRCNVKRIYTINFDRKKIRKYMTELSEQADKVSSDIDRQMVMAEVEYVTPFNVNDSFQEVFEAFEEGDLK